MSKWIHEKVANGEFITWEVNPAFTREAIPVDATAGEIQPGTILEYAPGKFGIVVNRVPKGRVGKVAAIVRGGAIVILDLLIYPAVTAPDGPDVGSDNVAESAAATAAKRAEIATFFEAKGIVARN